MANDDDPTTATPASQTQPLPPTHERAPGSPSKTTTGWRPAQVAVVAFLALLLGGAGGALVYFLTDDDSTDDSDLATDLTTTTSTTTDESSTSSSTTAEPDPDRTAEAPEATSGRGPGGETAVGNSIFTATYQSDEDRSTGAIDVDDDWKVRWDVPTGAVTIEVLDAGGEVVETIDAQGQGERTFADGGTYQMEIDSNGSRYTVVITDGP